MTPPDVSVPTIQPAFREFKGSHHLLRFWGKTPKATTNGYSTRAIKEFSDIFTVTIRLLQLSQVASSQKTLLDEYPPVVRCRQTGMEITYTFVCSKDDTLHTGRDMVPELTDGVHHFGII